MIKVLINGAGGKMGRAVVKAVQSDPELQLVGGVDKGLAGEDLGVLAGIEKLQLGAYADLKTALAETTPHVVVDFTSPVAVFSNAKTILQSGAHAVIGTTGLTVLQRDELDAIGREHHTHILVAPNFSMGAVMMMKTAAELAPYFPNVEIIELHHNHKYDAPSGTAILTAEMIAESRTNSGVDADVDATKETLPGARGAHVKGIPIHSVRLPGYVAHQEVLLGGYGETLTIRHDSLSRESFMPGVVLACKRISNFEGLTYGLENYL